MRSILRFWVRVLSHVAMTVIDKGYLYLHFDQDDVILLLFGQVYCDLVIWTTYMIPCRLFHNGQVHRDIGSHKFYDIRSYFSNTSHSEAPLNSIYFRTVTSIRHLICFIFSPILVNFDSERLSSEHRLAAWGRCCRIQTQDPSFFLTATSSRTTQPPLLQ